MRRSGTTKRFTAVPVAVAVIAAAALSWSPWSAPEGAGAGTSALASPISASGPDEAQAKAAAAQAYGDLPISFEANAGQSDPSVDFLSRGPGYSLFLTPTEAVMSLQAPAEEADLSLAGASGDVAASTENNVLRMRAVGANPAPQPSGDQRQPGTINYLKGNDPNAWHTGVPTFAGVTYDEVYPGIDMAWHGANGELEYDFIVEPGTDPSVVGVAFDGAESMDLDDEGNLVLGVGGQELLQRKPVLYQDIAGTRRPVEGSFVLQGPGQVGFQIGAYDVSEALVIDPTIVYSSFLGGSGGDLGSAIDVAPDGSAYVSGNTCSPDFPVVNPIDSFSPPPGECSFNGDAFLTKYSPEGQTLLYSTYLGGSLSDQGQAIELAEDGSVYVFGRTMSTDFPTTVGAFDTTAACNSDGNCRDAFLTVIGPDGGITYSTYLGGTESEGFDEFGFAGGLGEGIALNSDGSVYLVGATASSDFPVTPDAFDTSHGGRLDAFVSLINPSLPGDGSGTVSPTNPALIYSTFLGGPENDSVSDVAVDGTGQAYVSGGSSSEDFPTTAGSFIPTRPGSSSGVVVKIDPSQPGDGTGTISPTNAALIYSTFLGGSSFDAPVAIAVDQQGNAIVTGFAASADYPVKNAFQSTFGGFIDAVVTKLNPDGSDLVYSSYLGGAGFDVGADITVDALGNAYLSGRTNSFDLPTNNPIQAACRCGENFGDVLLAAYDPVGTNLLSTFVGGGGEDAGSSIALDTSGAIYVTGLTLSTQPTPEGFLGRSAAQPEFGGGFTDGFIVKIRNDDANDGTCDGLEPTLSGTGTIMGTAGNDVIVGSSGDDLIIGGGGNDTICGGDGNDTIDGRAGNDRIFGQGGNDRLTGASGNDFLDGGEGNDRLAGDAGDDELVGGNGDDVLQGGEGNDRSAGGAGSDVLTDGGGDDILRGEDGNDTLRGGPGNDILRGGDDSITLEGDNDRLLGETGDDQLFGGNGNDVLNGGPGTNACDGGDGTNRLTNCE